MRQAKRVICSRLKSDTGKAKPAPCYRMCRRGGNEPSEATGRELPDRNASEGIEPRNISILAGLTVFMYWKATMRVATGRAILSCPGSETTVWRRRQKHELGRPCGLPEKDTDGQPEKREGSLDGAQGVGPAHSRGVAG